MCWHSFSLWMVIDCVLQMQNLGIRLKMAEYSFKHQSLSFTLLCSMINNLEPCFARTEHIWVNESKGFRASFLILPEGGATTSRMQSTPYRDSTQTFPTQERERETLNKEIIALESKINHLQETKYKNIHHCLVPLFFCQINVAMKAS